MFLSFSPVPPSPFQRRPLNRLRPQPQPPAVKAPTHGDLLRGAYGPYRANNDLLFYHLDLRVDPDKKFISGTNTVRFKMLQDGTRIQLELYPTLQIDKIVMGPTTLKYDRDEGTFYVDFPRDAARWPYLFD